MIDSSLMTRVNPGTAVGSSACRRADVSVRAGLWERFSGPQLIDGRGRSVSISAGDPADGHADIRIAGAAGDAAVGALRAFAPLTKIAAGAPDAYGTAINPSVNNNETSAVRALSGVRAWSPPD